MKRKIYADCAATTPVSKEVLEAMLPWFSDCCGNPSSLHHAGRIARAAVQAAREHVAALIGAAPEEIYFTSGGTEANNWAIKGLSRSGTHIVTTAIEHPSVLRTIEIRERDGFYCTTIPVSAEGIIGSKEVRKAIKGDTALVSVMYANNEIGTIQPIDQIGRVCRQEGTLFHVDTVQAVGNISIDVEQLGIDMLSISAHKLGGPKGIGALYISRRVGHLNQLLHGGGQEDGMRSGTENIPAIVGMGEVMRLAKLDLSEGNTIKVANLRNDMIEEILKIPGSHLNGSPVQRLPGNASFSFEGVDSGALVSVLDLECGVMASSGSACSGSAAAQSHVLRAIGVPEDFGTVRLTINAHTTPADALHIAKAVERTVARLRSRS